MTNGNSAERERFETWWQTTNLSERDQAWRGWQARAALSVCADKQALRARICRALEMKGTFTDDQIVEAVWCAEYERRRLFSADVAREVCADGGKGEAVACPLFQTCAAPFVCKRSGECQMNNMKAQDAAILAANKEK